MCWEYKEGCTCSNEKLVEDSCSALSLDNAGPSVVGKWRPLAQSLTTQDLQRILKAWTAHGGRRLWRVADYHGGEFSFFVQGQVFRIHT
jgi:hypothetical protein